MLRAAPEVGAIAQLLGATWLPRVLTASFPCDFSTTGETFSLRVVPLRFLFAEDFAARLFDAAAHGISGVNHVARAAP